MGNVIVTGANGGLGSAIALHLARRGDTVYGTVRDPARATDLAAIRDAEALPIELVTMDVTDDASVVHAIADVRERAGRLDAVVNVAGIGNIGAMEDMHDAELRRIMETNFFGAIRATRAVLPTMRRQGAGAVVMITSLAGRVGIPGEFAYCASKFALGGAAEALRFEVERFGIRVALVEPGYFKTGMSGRSDLTRSVPRDSPYRELAEFLHDGEVAGEGDGDDPALVAEAVHDAIHGDAPAFRYHPGAMAPAVIAQRQALDDDAWHGAARELLALDWWARGNTRPAS